MYIDISIVTMESGADREESFIDILTNCLLLGTKGTRNTKRRRDYPKLKIRGRPATWDKRGSKQI